jgi:diguanylate cyclase (GGDEF)-like protein/PAS domain S-box-containing protein
MNSQTDSFDFSSDQQLHLLLRQAESNEVSVAQLREMLKIVGKQAASASHRNESLANAVVTSAEIIEELEQTRMQLAAAQDLAELAAGHRGQLTETIFERTHDAMMLLKKDGCCLLANQNAIRLFRFSRDCLAKANVFEWIADHFEVGDRALWKDALTLELDEHGLARREVCHRVADKNLCVEFSLSVFSMHESTHYLLIARDVTTRKELENELRRSRDFLHNTINAIPEQVCVKTSDLTMVLANDAYRTAYCLDAHAPQAEVHGQTVKSCDGPATEHIERALFEIGGDSEHEETLFDSHGSERTISTRRSVFRDPVSGEKFMVAASRDVTEQKKNQERMQLLASVFENAQESVVVLELDGRIREANPEFLRLTGLQLTDLLDRNFSEFVNSEKTEFDQVIATAFSGKPWFGRVRLNREQCKSDLDREVIYWGSLSVSRNEDSTATNLIAIFTDITQIEQTQKRLHRQAWHDNLTGLPNRRFFSQAIEEMIQSARDQNHMRFGVCFLDLDDFKVVNDTLGHDAGDQLLMDVADRIKGCIYRDCFLARFGGDEFALLVPENGDPDRIVAIANNVVKSLNLPFNIGENQVYVGVSIGMSICPDDASDVSQLLRHADLAMYHAKDEGKNTIRGFSPALAARLEERQSLFASLRSAIQNNEITLVYQPKMCLHTGRISGCEALVRWTKDGTAICPGEFIHVAEKSGLILSLGDQIIEMAMRQAKQWRDDSQFDGIVAINLSPRQVSDPDFFARFEELVAITETRPEWFELEITENSLSDHIDNARNLIKRLKSLGVEVSIDDFGTGYSSLTHLQSFPVASLKIDLSFVRDLPHDQRAIAIAETVLSLGHGLGMKVTAEGVETTEQHDFLKQSGCDVIQGYLINHPMPPAEFARWAQQQK